jgi:hypothetical protein
MPYVDFNNTYSLLFEQSLGQNKRVDFSRDQVALHNKFHTKPQAIIITDTYNNPFFPIRPRPVIDTSKFDLLEIYRRYKELYTKFTSLFLPWHYCIEFVDDQYVVFNTRPIDTIFPITNNEAKKDFLNAKPDEITSRFLKDNVYDISQCIHICIIGSTDKDIYTRRFYELLARTCIVPFLRQYKINPGINTGIFGFNIGPKLNMNLLIKFNKK